MRKLFYYKVFLTLLVVLVFSAGGVQFLWAQEEFTLEEITVTAEKREVNVQDAAMSVTAVTGADIRDKSIDDIESVLQNMAGVTMNLTTPAGAGVYIRGIGTNVNTSTADPSVQINLDGVYVGRAEIGFNSMYDIDRVEVLRGPQGTMYGRNAIGGTVNVISKRPSDIFEAEANLRLGNFDLKHFDASVNAPLSEKVSTRFALMTEERGSYFKPEGDSSDKFAGRARLSYKPTDNLSFLFTAEVSYDRSLDRPQVPLEGSAGNLKAGPMGAYTKPDVNNDGIADDFLDADLNPTSDMDGDGWPDGDGTPDIMQTGWLRPTGADEWTNDEWHADAPNRDYKFKIYSLEMNWDLGFTQMTLFPSFNDNYRDFSIRGVMFGSSIEDPWDYGDYTASEPSEEEQWSYEVRFQNPDESPIKWLIGYYAMESDNKPVGEPQDPTTYGDDDWHFTNYFQPTKTTAYFGQATYPFTERFRVTGGLRGSTDDRKRTYRFANAQLDPSSPLYAETNGTGIYDSGMLTYSDEADTTTYKAGIEFDLNEDSMIYAQVTTGFKQGGLNSTVPPDTFDPEELISYSIGSKNRFMNDRLQLNAEAYYYDYQGFQIQTGVMYTHEITGQGMMDFMYVVNADDASIKGLEMELDWLVTQNDQLSFSGTYTDSEYGHTILPFNPMAGTPPMDLIGGEMANAPKWTFTLGWEHTWIMQDSDEISARVFTKVSDDYWATVEKNLIGTLQEQYHQSELSMSYRPGGGKWSASIWAKNLENKAITLRTMPIYRKFISEPRTFGMNFSIRY